MVIPMKNPLGRMWAGFCRRPLMWLSIILAAGLTVQWLIMYWELLTFYNESILYTLVEYAIDVMIGQTVMTDIVFLLLLIAINLVFLLRGKKAGEPERRAGIRVEWFSLVYCALRAGSWMMYIIEASGYDWLEIDIDPGVVMVSGAMLLPAAVGYIVFRTARKPLSSSAIRLIIILAFLGVAGCGLLTAHLLPGMILCPLCVAAAGAKIIPDGIRTLTRLGAEKAAAPETEVGQSPDIPSPDAELAEEEPSAAEIPAESEGDKADETAPEDTYPVNRSLILSLLAVVGILMVFFSIPLCIGGRAACGASGSIGEDIYGVVLFLWVAALFLFLPGALTLTNIVLLFICPWRMSPERRGKAEKVFKWIEYITLGWGFICTLIWTEFNFSDIRWSDWDEQLYNSEVHAPIATWTVPTVAVLMLVSLAGYLVLRLTKQDKRPPLVSALAIASLYIGGGLSVVWILQTAFRDPVICLLSFNIVLIYIKTIRDVVVNWRHNHPEAAEHKSAVVRFFARIMNNSANWPWTALLLAAPLLGVVVALLTLFGQSPDSIIQAWTQTADWTFSQQTAPPNLHYDEHYLCTVAAGGHKRVVKPIRKGKRHGHEVTVNRQLCVANAFEQLLEERLPRFHSVVRGFYDKYGYPIARHIKTPLAADVVWIIMKPLEWLFLAVLYLFDPKPENRIAVQYPHAPLTAMNKTEER